MAMPSSGIIASDGRLWHGPAKRLSGTRDMHSDQIDIDVALVAKLIHDQFPQFRGQPVVALENVGTTNAIFRIGARHAARLPLRRMDPGECASALEAEMRASTEFNACSAFPGPQPVGMGQPGSTYPLPWTVYTWMPGEIATPGGLSASSIFARDLARLIRALREADLHGRAFDGQGRGGSLPDHDDWMKLCFSNSERLLDVKRLRPMWASFRELPSPAHDVMSHRDLIPANLLVRGERLIGVLDTGAFGPADPSLDLVAGWHLLDRDRRHGFREALQIDDVAWRRGAAWAFQQAMGLVWYYAETNPTMSELGRSTIARLIGDYDSLV